MDMVEMREDLDDEFGRKALDGGVHAWGWNLGIQEMKYEGGSSWKSTMAKLVRNG
jgi:hypothetical protein